MPCFPVETEPIVVHPPIAESSERPRRENRRLPMRYRVEPPTQLPCLPPPDSITPSTFPPMTPTQKRSSH
ncbi:hypothetical protein HYPSUDRAFT_210416 [Hypholoma sublateritium FD-334 SS-4]|uniref:Uncharacterized protein n=1 Tax=Hypholoma sublateritium (strain FD-334 SS-4) TaxID=945553 RepID=A0A0D2KD71_HYPSF|nr:hypothetical protein HYPSUDRAFT_210416 [Hypholoma sublateritium FD-334 SS-4]